MNHGSADGAAGADYEALIQFLYLAPVGLVQTRMDGEIVMINPISAQLLMPLSRNGDLANLFTTLENVAPELRLMCDGFDRESGMICDGQYIYLHTGGQSKGGPQILSLSLLKLDGERLMAVLNDVTLQVKRERQLRQNDAWLNAILTSITDYALVGLDRNGRICEWNASVGRVTGHGDAVVGKTYSIFYPAEGITREQLGDRLREADQNGWSLDEGTRQRADGARFWGSTLITPLPHRDETPLEADEAAYCLVLRDISDKREASELQRRNMFSDHLTGLANRRAFFEAGELEMGRYRHAPRPTSLIVIDIDHFKQINDSHGHPGGDAVLRHLAVAARAVFREVDVVARVGGDEFAALLPSTDLEGAATVAERLRASIAAHEVHIDGARIAYTVSIGAAEMDEDIAILDDLIKRADQALYAAKACGRNRAQRWMPEHTGRKNQSPT
jgi:diguanylate cyclase (GGDEF)-like protein/PAS domain S-box-containing protein